MANLNILLGNGESLVEDLQYSSAGGLKTAPYTFDEALKRLYPMLTAAATDVLSLPDDACPGNRAVLSLTLHPSFIAKSYFPGRFLKLVKCDVVGNKHTRILPEKMPNAQSPSMSNSVVLFAFGNRDDLEDWQRDMTSWDRNVNSGYGEIASIEAIFAPSPLSKVTGVFPDSDEMMLEVMLHPSESSSENTLLLPFREYLANRNLAKYTGKTFAFNGLSYIGVRADRENIEDISKFSGVRTVRAMPRIRNLQPASGIRSIAALTPRVPSESAVSSSVRVALFDGGVPDGHVFDHWVTRHDSRGIHVTEGETLEHGTAVTSAALFGPIKPDGLLQRPFANIDHFTIIDQGLGNSDEDLHDVLDRIHRVLNDSGNAFHFINFSVGPEKQVEDHDVDAWTVCIDRYLSKNDCLATIAVGNNGELDEETMQNRVLVPSDCVNALSVGACDSMKTVWYRAPYSAVGPGRSPGIVKPDLVFFGGTESTPFWAFDASASARLKSVSGTSFSAPSVLHLATKVKASLESQVNAQTIRALLVHTTQRRSQDIREVGWGRCTYELSEILYCDDCEVRVVYQGCIAPSKFIRAEIPIPSGLIDGFVVITATICYRTLIDPHHPASYTRTSLDVLFRPHSERFLNETSSHPKTDTFFKTTESGAAEAELRELDMKWECCRHAVKRKRGTSLNRPVFDIHCNTRQESHDYRPSAEIPYALVVTVKAKNVSDLYSRISQQYSGKLTPMKIAAGVPIQRDFDLTDTDR